MKTTNIMIVGVGGQGSLLASKLLGNLLVEEGYDVKVSEVHGMSQRGGSVVTYVRFGEKVYSPIIDKGEADYIVSFEKIEAARYASYLKVGGKLIVNTQEIDPMPVITGAAEYPTDALEKLCDLGKGQSLVVGQTGLTVKDRGVELVAARVHNGTNNAAANVARDRLERGNANARNIVRKRQALDRARADANTGKRAGARANRKKVDIVNIRAVLLQCVFKKRKQNFAVCKLVFNGKKRICAKFVFVYFGNASRSGNSGAVKRSDQHSVNLLVFSSIGSIFNFKASEGIASSKSSVHSVIVNPPCSI